MRSKKTLQTPREIAYEITCGWIQAAHRGHTGDVSQLDDTESFHKEVRKQLAKLHNRLADTIDLEIYLGD